MGARGQAANPLVQRKLAERHDRLQKMRESDLAWVLGQPQGRRWFWLTFCDELMQPVPTESNTSMTLDAGLRNFCIKKISEAQQHASAFQTAFSESIERAMEARLFEESIEKELKES